MILDVMLDSEDGFSILAQIRRTSDLPVILVTARSQESDRVFGLKLGADDYVVKPFSSAELAARIETVLRRVRGRRPAASVAARLRRARDRSRRPRGPGARAQDRAHRQGVRASPVPRPIAAEGVHPRASSSPRSGIRRPTGRTPTL